MCWSDFGRGPASVRFHSLTNNAAERALRGLALGRRSWLFAGSDRGGTRAAMMYSLIMTCRRTLSRPSRTRGCRGRPRGPSTMRQWSGQRPNRPPRPLKRSGGTVGSVGSNGLGDEGEFHRPDPLPDVATTVPNPLPAGVAASAAPNGKDN